MAALYELEEARLFLNARQLDILSLRICASTEVRGFLIPSSYRSTRIVDLVFSLIDLGVSECESESSFAFNFNCLASSLMFFINASLMYYQSSDTMLRNLRA